MNNNVELTAAFLVWCPPHHEQYYRPYEGILTGETMNYLNGITDRGLTINNNTLNPIAINILRPSQVPVAPVNIDGGFGNARFAFFLEFTINNPGIFTSAKKEIVTGFTNHAGVDHFGNLDPKMVFYINSRQVIHCTPKTVTAVPSPTNSYLKQNQNILPMINTLMGQKPVSLRPEDIVSNHHIQDCYGDSVPIINKTYDLSCGYQTASRDSNIPSYYLDRLLKGYKDSYNDTTAAESNEDVFRNITSAVRTEGLFGSNFLALMRGAGDCSNQGSFQFWEIQERWPRNNDFWKKQLPKPNTKPISLREMTEHWQGTGAEVDIAYNLTHALPALMSKLLILSIELDLTNLTIDGTSAVGIIRFQPMFDYAVTPDKLEFFKQRVMADIINGIILQKVPSFHIKIKSHLLSDNLFEISVAGGPYIPFSAPMYCESYYSPLIGSAHHLTNLTGQVKTIVDQFKYFDSFQNQTQNNQSQPNQNQSMWF